MLQKKTESASRILDAYAALHDGQTPTPEGLAPADHFHAGGLPATKAMAKELALVKGEQVLDIGCGIGGPARWIAKHFNVTVQGIDLSAAFIDTGRALTSACLLSSHVMLQEGNATALPQQDAAFDKAYSQNVAMNIEDKSTFFHEAYRVLRPGGLFACSIFTRLSDQDPRYPMPWSQDGTASYLETAKTLSDIAQEIGFMLKAQKTDSKQDAEKMLVAVEARGLPVFSLSLLLGEDFDRALINSLRAQVDGLLGNTLYIFQK